MHRLNTAQQEHDRITARLARPAERVGRERFAARAAGRAIAALRSGSVGERSATVCAARHRARCTALAMLDARMRHREQQLATRLRALDPMQVVARGYALIHTGAGELVVAPQQIVEGDESAHDARARRSRLRVGSVRRK